MKRLVWLVGVICLFASASLSAQEPVSLAPGMRVRVRVPTIYRQQWLVGTVESIDSGTLVLRSDRAAQAGLFALPLTAVERIDLSRGTIAGASGTTLRAKQGFAVGVFAGLLFGAILADEGSYDDQGEFVPHSHALLKGSLKAVAILGAAGATAGAVIGSHGGERWETVSTSGFRLGLARDPYTGGIRVSLGT